MAKIIGKQTSVGVAKEAVRGTAETTPTFWIPFSDFSFDDQQTRVDLDQAYGVTEDAVGQMKASEWSEGTIKFPIYDKTIGLFLLSLLGSLSSATHSGETTVKDHTIINSQNVQKQSLTIFVKDPATGVDYKFPLACVGSVEINQELNKLAEATISMKSKLGVVANGLTPSIAAENMFLNKHLSFKMASAASGLGAASATGIKKINLKIDNGLEADESMGTGASGPSDFIAKKLSISGSIEALYQNETDFKNAGLGVTKKAMRIDYINNDVTIGTASNPEVRIDLNKAIFEPIAVNRAPNNLVSQTAKFRGFYDLTDAKALSILLSNLQTSY